MPVAIPIAIAASAAAGIGGAVLESGAASNAAQTQSQTSQQIASEQLQAQREALAFQQEVLGLNTANEQPFIQAGQGAENALASGLGITPAPASPISQAIVGAGTNIAQGIQGGSANALGGISSPILGSGITGTATQDGSIQAISNQLAGNPGQRGRIAPIANGGAGAQAGGLGTVGTVGAPSVSANGIPLNTTGALNSTALNEQWATPFVAPTASQAAATPGEQFALQSGQQAIQNSAAAQGNLLSGSTLKGLDAYSQGLASQYYQQAYNNALNQYQQNYNIFNQNQGQQFNRLASLAGQGQTAVGQLGSLSGQSAGQIGNTLLQGTQAIGQAQQNAAAATASGYVGSANALAGGISNIGNSLGSLALLQSLQHGGGIDPSAYGSYLPDPGIQAIP